MKICVFCSSSNGVDDSFFDASIQLGQLIAEKGNELVYGGANVGLMEELAGTVKKYGGRVTGVIPEKIHRMNLASNYPDELIITGTMGERKKLMHSISDAFIALPGGFGTLEEILEVITLKQLDYHQKPVIFININGFYDKLLEQFEHSFSTGFAKENYRNLYQVVDTPQAAINYIDTYRPKHLGTKWF